MIKKGITPILSVVLLLMMTVAAFGLVYFWVSDTQKDLQNNVGEGIKEKLSKTQMSVQIISVYNDTNTGHINISINNNGKGIYDIHDIWDGSSSKINILIDGIPVTIANMDLGSAGDDSYFTPGEIIPGIELNKDYNDLDDGDIHEIKILMPGGFQTSTGCLPDGRSFC